jgi:hypothetical protein
MHLSTILPSTYMYPKQVIVLLPVVLRPFQFDLGFLYN